MMRLASILAFAVPFAAYAFSVQVSITGRDSSGAWFSMAEERSGGAFNGYPMNGRTLFFKRGELLNNRHFVGAIVMFPLDTARDNAEGKICITPAYIDYSVPSMGGWFASGPSIEITPENAEAHAFDRFELAYGDVAWSNCVFTVRGNPYSLVMNNTATARTINGVEIGAFTGKELLFPLVLITSYDAGLSFYDLDSGEPLSASYNYDRYSLMWAGNIELRDGSTPGGIPVVTNLDQIVFADIKGGSTADKVLYAENGNPVYAGMVSIATNVELCTWWEFDQGEWGNNPQAKINGEVVCDGHSTDHLIAYTVNTGTIHASEMSGKASFTFTMSQDPVGNYAGGACVFKCWDAENGATKEGYAATPDAHRAAISGNTSTIATFRVTINKYTGDWKVEPVN